VLALLALLVQTVQMLTRAGQGPEAAAEERGWRVESFELVEQGLACGVRVDRHQLYLLYWYKSANTDT